VRDSESAIILAISVDVAAMHAWTWYRKTGGAALVAAGAVLVVTEAAPAVPAAGRCWACARW
jgi:hypothetical protein